MGERRGSIDHKAKLRVSAQQASAAEPIDLFRTGMGRASLHHYTDSKATARALTDLVPGLSPQVPLHILRYI